MIRHFGNSFYFNGQLYCFVKIGDQRWWKTVDGMNMLQGGFYDDLEKDKELIISDLKK